ncbi:hypothetical protein VTN00DRAFT_5043 [Thermoascus crustaceus]|uniref:uncharacterized protein n=1 Tax=Thermoascus crustaceus TaxID=5088 RepID=UPI0037442327
MAEEHDLPKGPLSPTKPNEQQKSSLAHPEFGKPSPLRPSFRQKLPFNIPKPNQPRVEHHRPAAPRSEPQQHRQNGPHRDISGGSVSPTKPSQPFTPMKQPFTPMKKSSAYNRDDEDVVEITRPSNFTWTTPRAPKTIYSSKPNKVTDMSKNLADKNLRNFIDLTTEDTGFATNSRHHKEEFGAMDAYSYVDAAKANENIKALLEGAFEDEDDKPRTRSRKKKAEAAKSEIDDLASKLQGVSVNDAKDKEEDAAGEAEEEEVDDGTRAGLKVKLLPHQIDGVNWMCDKETGRKKTRGVLPKGGILADDMGLGKTIQAIALILSNPKSKAGEAEEEEDEETDDNKDGEKDNEKEKEKKKKKRKFPPGLDKGTLVVAPLALIKQWESEILAKVADSHRLRVCVYHGAGRSKLTDDLKDYDVVITTYGTLSSEHGGKSTNKSGLFDVYWYRIILDEAHTIKNRNAKATQAACALNAEYRWCLTGTPLQNNLDELQSLIKFLRIKPYNDLTAWRDQITRPLNNGRGGLAIKRLQVYLKAFMKRRTKDVLKLNDNLKPGEQGDGGNDKKSSSGFQITKREVIKVNAEFTPAEMNFYKRLEERTDRSLEKMMGGSKLDYAGALVLLLRLRQACNHPDLVKSDLAQDKDVLLSNGTSGGQSKAAKHDDIDDVADLFGGLTVETKKCDVCQIELSKEEAKSGASRCSECEADLKIDFAGKKEKKEKKKKQEKESKEKHEKNAIPESTPVRRSSEAQKMRSQRNRRVVLDSDDEEEDGEWIVPEDQRTESDLGKAGGTDDEDAEGGGEWLGSEDSETDEDEEDDIESPSRRRAKDVISLSSSDSNRESSKSDDEDEETDSEAETDAEDDEEFLSDDEDDNDVLASTKIRHLMKILRRECSDYKFIVFSFFTSMLDKIEPFLKREGIGFSRYDGGMRNDLREASLNKLRNHSGTRILLCSLRAGALGLNLTAASRVVLLEPFWNPFVEEQAIDRVHRLNQTLDVKIYKMTIKDTVEERIVDLQERKRELANATIEGKTAAGKLTMRDMMALFGREAESRFEHDGLDLTQKTKLLGSKDEDDYGSGTPSSLQSTSAGQGRRANPPVMERDRAKKAPRPPRAEDSVYGRRW